MPTTIPDTMCSMCYSGARVGLLDLSPKWRPWPRLLASSPVPPMAHAQSASRSSPSLAARHRHQYVDPTGTSWVERSGGYSTAPRHGIFTRSLLDRDSFPVHRDLHGGALAADV